MGLMTRICPTFGVEGIGLLAWSSGTGIQHYIILYYITVYYTIVYYTMLYYIRFKVKD